MSSVYCAFDTLLERNVALKILHDQYGDDEEYVERFRREARSVAQLSHPNIVTVIDRGEEDGKQFIVFELIEGDNLKELVERGGPLPVRRALELGLEVGRALAFAHGQGLIHRDVKPQNVLLNDDGHAKVTDFGIARSLDGVGHTETGTVLGTSHYIAPEQARGEQIDAQTDIYSFGVVLYELLTGELPYPGDNFLTVAMKHVNDPSPNVLDRRPDTPLRLASLIERCMAKAPADRPASMADVVAELEACVAELDAKAGDEGTMIMKRPKPAKPAYLDLAILIRALEGLAASVAYGAALDHGSLWAGLFDLRENLLGRTLEDLRAYRKAGWAGIVGPATAIAAILLGVVGLFLGALILANLLTPIIMARYLLAAGGAVTVIVAVTGHTSVGTV
jgi:serine/threonine-protein kinase